MLNGSSDLDLETKVAFAQPDLIQKPQN